VCERDCITIKPSKVPNPSKIPDPSKVPAASKVAPPEYFTIQVTYPCDNVPSVDCCDFYDTLPDATSAYWSLCGPDSADSRMPTFDSKNGECTIYLFALSGSNGISDSDFQAAQDSVVASLCPTDASACDVTAKDGQSLATIYAGSSSVLTISAMLLACVLAALL
jgi:hypothetical protein